MFKIKILPILGCARNYLFKAERVFRVSPLEGEFHGWLCRSLALDASLHLRCPAALTTGSPPAEAAGVAEASHHRETPPPLPQGIGGLPPIFDIDTGSIPLNDVSRL